MFFPLIPAFIPGKPCFSVCFDNVNQKTTVRHQTRDKKNKMFNMVQAYAALDRINTLHLSDEQPSPDDILNIPLFKLLPCELDEVDLRSQMTVLVERILCKRIPFFNEMEDKILWHIPHQYSQLSTKKSEMVGVKLIIHIYMNFIIDQTIDYIKTLYKLYLVGFTWCYGQR